MSSTNKTPHLQLNQWVPSDPFLMEDMNADNQKIDAAIVSNPWVKLMDVTLQTAISSVELNLTGLDLSKFVTLRVYYLSNNLEDQLNLRWNKIASGYTYMGAGSSSMSSTCSITPGQVDIELTGSKIYAHNSYYTYFELYGGINPSKLTTIDLLRDSNGSSNFAVGRRFVLMGVRV